MVLLFPSDSIDKCVFFDVIDIQTLILLLMLIRPFRAVLPNMKLVSSPKTFFSSVREKYPNYKKGNFFRKAAKEAIYVIQITREGEKHEGLVTCAHIDEFTSQRIKKHENTISAKEQQQIDLILSRGAGVKPVLVFHKEVKKISEWIKEVIGAKKRTYEVKFNDKEVHKIWSVTDAENVEHICKLYKKHIKEAYIADGHHRCSSTALMSKNYAGESINPYEYLMTSFFPSNQLKIYDFNRIINLLDQISPVRFVAKLSKYCNIEPIKAYKSPSAKFEMTMYLRKEWYTIKWKKELLNSSTNILLDANLMNKYIMTEILQIEDIRTDTRIKYLEGVKPLLTFKNHCNKLENGIGFVLYPVDISDLVEVADQGKIMPPKSTWFEPRMKNGLLVQEFKL